MRLAFLRVLGEDCKPAWESVMEHGRKVKLSTRLNTIACYAKTGKTVVDVGTDHGYIPSYLAKNEFAHYIIATDISEKALKAAHKTAIAYGVEEKITFIKTKGLSGIFEYDPDTIILSGMGAETIAGILADAPWTKQPGVSIIVQPQTKTGYLCLWLNEHGYKIHDATLTCERGRIYIVMLVGTAREKGKEAKEQGTGYASTNEPYASVPETELLRILSAKKDQLYEEYVDLLISKAKRAAEGMAKSNAKGYEKMEYRVKMLTKTRGKHNQ